MLPQRDLQTKEEAHKTMKNGCEISRKKQMKTRRSLKYHQVRVMLSCLKSLRKYAVNFSPLGYKNH